MRDYCSVKPVLEKSAFRSKFRLDARDRAYIDKAGLAAIEKHAREFIEKRLSAIAPEKDGRQTPFKGHPLFKAQHATATCCRGCLLKWYALPKQRPLTEREKTLIGGIVMDWIHRNMAKDLTA